MGQKRAKVFKSNPIAPNRTGICANCGLSISWVTINNGPKGFFVHTYSDDEECATRFATPLMGSSRT